MFDEDAALGSRAWRRLRREISSDPLARAQAVTQQDLDNATQTNSPAVTTVSTLDPIKATFTASAQEYIGFTRRNGSMQNLQLELILADGSTYWHKGKFSFADREVNRS
ncbi:MAG: hypothetical protein ABSH56_24925 [Bryobacteraceae bacterium]|jgi:hypothetical protein